MPVKTTDLSQLSDANQPNRPTYQWSTRTVDCNVVKTCEAVGYVTGTLLNVHTARQQANQSTGPTGLVFAHSVFVANGLVPGVDFQLLWQAPTDTIRQLLRAKWYLGVILDYGVLNSLTPETSGDRNFHGLHCVGIHGLWRGPMGLTTHKHDPLNDGRRPAIKQGIVNVKFGHIRDAAYAYTKKPGYIQAWAVKPR